MQNTKNIIKYLILAGLFLVPFIPFIVPAAMFFPFITGKGFAFRIITEIIFGLFVILAFWDKEYRPKLSWVTKSVLIFTLAVFVADLAGVNVSKSLWSNYERMEGFVLIIHLAMYYIVASSVFFSKEKWLQFFNVSIASSVLMSLYASAQLYCSVPGRCEVGSFVINQGGNRVDGTFGNAAYFAIYLVFHIFLCLYFAIDSAKPKWQRWSYAGAALFNTFILYYTATRGAILGLIGGIIISGIIIVLLDKQNVALKKVSYYALGFMALVIVGFISVRNTDYVRNNQILSRFSTLGISEIKTQGRYFVWPMAIKGFKEHPVLGWGQENFNFVFNKNYDARMFGQEQWFDRTHDIFLDWLIAGGLVGLLSYLGLYFAMLFYVWRKESTLSISEKAILTGLVGAYVFHNIFVFDNLVSYIMFFSVLGFVHSTMAVDKTNNSLEGFYTKTFSSDVVNYIVSPIVVIGVVLTVYFVNVPAILANQTLIQAMTSQKAGVLDNLNLFKKVYSYNSFGNTETTEQLLQIATQISGSNVVPDSAKQQFYDLATEKIEEKLKQTPNDARYLVFAGSYYNRIGKYDLAIENLKKAIVESPNKQSIYAELGTSYLAKGDMANMFEQMKKSYELATSSKEAQIMYAIAAIYTKNSVVWADMFSKLGEETIVNDNRFLQTYFSIKDYNTAIVVLNKRLSKNPTSMQDLYYLAITYGTSGQKQKAVDVVRQMINQNQDYKTDGENLIKQILSN